MKNIKKILTGTIVSALSITAIGCGVNTQLTKKYDSTSEITSRAYVYDNKSPEKLGKIVETSNVSAYNSLNKKSKKKDAVISTANNFSFLNNNISELEIENAISKPSDVNSFNVFVLSDIPFITMTSDDNNSNYLFNIRFTSNSNLFNNRENKEKLNELSLKKSILMLYTNEIYNENVTFSNEDKIAISNHLNTLKNGVNSNLSNELSENKFNLKNNFRPTPTTSYSNENTLNSDIDLKIQAIDSIISIIENNLINSSCYYNSKLTDTLNNINSNSNEALENTDITNNSTNKEIAKIISNSLKMSQNSQKSQEFSKKQLNNSQTENLNNKSINTTQNNINTRNTGKSNNISSTNNLNKSTTTNTTKQSTNSNNISYNKENNNLNNNEKLSNNNLVNNSSFNKNTLNNQNLTVQNNNINENNQNLNQLTQPSNIMNNNQNNSYDIETNNLNNSMVNNSNRNMRNNRRNTSNNQNNGLINNKTNTSLNNNINPNNNHNLTTQVESNKKHKNISNNQSLNTNQAQQNDKNNIDSQSINNNILRFNNNFENEQPNYIASAYAPAENKAIRVPYKSADNMKI